MNRLFHHLGRFLASLMAAIRDGIARGIIRARVPANAVTLAGPVAMTFIFWPLIEGDQWMAGWVGLLAITFDALDGAVARVSRRVTRFGAYLDSVVDRYADILLMFALLAYLIIYVEPSERTAWFIIWCFATAGTVVTSYARARAENVIPGCAIGFLERPERTVGIIVGLVTGNVHLSLIVVAIFGNLIAAQRIYYTRAILDGRTPASGFRFWTYRRGSAEHAMLSTACFFFIVLGHLLIPAPA